MKILKRLMQIILITISLILLSNIQSKASSDLFLNYLLFDVQINQDGSMNVVETWDIDIEDTNTLYKTFVRDSSKYSSISDFVVKEIIDGKEVELTKTNTWAYHLEENTYYGGLNEDGKYEIAFGVGLEDESDNRKYKLEYKVNDAIAKYSDYAELYWQFIGEDFEIPARDVAGTIYLPENAQNQEDIKVWGHVESLNGEIYATGLNKIEFHLDGFNPGRYVEIRTLFPTNMISSSTRGTNREILEDVIEEETIWANEANQRRENKKRIDFIILISIIGITLIITIIVLRKYLKYRKIEKEMPDKNKPSQEIVYYREIPREDATPAEAEYVIKESKATFDENEIGKIFSATLLDLSLKKIIEFEVDKNKKDKDAITIKILKDEASELENEKDEKEIFEFLKNAAMPNKEINIKELLKYIKRSTSKVIKLKNNIDKYTKESVINKKIIDKDELAKYSKCTGSTVSYMMLAIFTIIIAAYLTFMFNIYVLIGFVPLLLISSLTCAKVGKVANKLNVYTQKGIDESKMWEGLKKYMEEFSMLDKREVPELVIWEKFLVYATVFGIADKVLKQLKIVYPNIDETLNVNTYTYMYLMMNTNFSSSFSSAVSTSISSTYSSGTGGGGGFSGGGGGGGRTAEVVAEDKPLPNNPYIMY